MRFLFDLAFLCNLLVLSDVVTSVQAHEAAGLHEDEGYWSRFVMDVADSFPSEQPSETPSAAPSPAPSAAPSPAPSAGPSPAPSAAPSEPPSAAPSPAPSAGPSPAPSTPDACLVDVEVVCFSDDGTPCNEVVVPTGECAVGNEINVLKFRLTDCSCGDSLSGQDDNFACTETDTPIPAEGSSVTVSCSDVDGNLVYEETSTIGGSIAVQDNSGEALPDVLVCTVTADGSELQTLTINTSGDVELNLTDKYGVLEVEACAVEGVPVQECIVPVVYTYTLENIGSTDMDITVLERTRNGVIVDLTDQVTDRNPLSPGDTASTSDNEDLNVCIDGIYLTTVRAEADPPNGVPCTDEVAFGST
jgi:hypothetical protein